VGGKCHHYLVWSRYVDRENTCVVEMTCVCCYDSTRLARTEQFCYDIITIRESDMDSMLPVWSIESITLDQKTSSKQMPVSSVSGLSSKSVKAVQMKPLHLSTYAVFYTFIIACVLVRFHFTVIFVFLCFASLIVFV